MKATKKQLIDAINDLCGNAKSLIQEIDPEDITLRDFNRLEKALSYIQALINIANKS